MKASNIGLDQAELDEAKEAILTYDVSDEGLEAAACLVRDCPGSQTISFCSGLDTCPS